MKRAREIAPATEGYRRLLLAKRKDAVSGMDTKFDTLARMGRVAEEDQAPISHEEFISLRINSLDYGQLRLVEEALDRLDAGDYGICLECEEPIPAKRLAAIPWARYCITCQDRAGNVGEAFSGQPRPVGLTADG